MTERRIHAPRISRYLPTQGTEFVSVEVLSGIALLLAAASALIWANVDASSYADLWGTHLTIGIGDLAISESLLKWVNDGLMVLFFFVVGLEIKRELVEGELRDPRAAALPVLGAFGGMLVPALIFVAFNAGGAGSRGWGIPMATDIAFALGVLALLGPRIPSGLKLFLLTLAIVDDVGAILVIAVFYTSDMEPMWLIGAAAAIVGVLVLRRVGVMNPWVYVLPGVVLWVCTHESGIHATIAGVALGLLTPVTRGPEAGPLETLERRLHPWTSFLIVPIFALANAGVVLAGDSLERAAGSAITWGVIAGLVVGKVIGVSVFALGARRLGIGRLPDGVRGMQVIGAGILAGIGFTVSIFVANLSFGSGLLDEAKIGVLGASLIAGILGAIWLRAVGRPSVPPIPEALVPAPESDGSR
ncbi:MAG TPA: Na+/H+ antiporter NhaA [Acidimicrobiia bacterium]|nr:Na+/H+ antiporter NhaA [Acidimicrobiia bacterium]